MGGHACARVPHVKVMSVEGRLDGITPFLNKQDGKAGAATFVGGHARARVPRQSNVESMRLGE